MPVENEVSNCGDGIAFAGAKTYSEVGVGLRGNCKSKRDLSHTEFVGDGDVIWVVDAVGELNVAAHHELNLLAGVG